MFTDAYLAAEHAARLQREWADEASRSRLARLATAFRALRRPIDVPP